MSTRSDRHIIQTVQNPKHAKIIMTNLLASICVPTYNGGKYLRECFDSIQAQTLADFEVLVTDDASTDDTFAIAEEYARKDARFRVYRNTERLGLVGNWNRCLEFSRGTWIKNMAQDDLLEPACLQALISACERHQRPFGFCDRNLLFDGNIDQENRDYFTWHQGMVAKNFTGAVDAETFARVCIAAPNINPVGEPVTVIFHRSVCEKYGNFNPLLIQTCDAEYWMRVGCNTGVVRVPERLASFRIHGKSTTMGNLSRQKYRAWYLDPLVIRYLFLYGQHYENVRRLLYQRPGRLLAWWEFFHFARYVENIARSQPANAEGIVPEMQEWKAMMPKLPGLSGLMLAGRMCLPLQQLLAWAGLTRRSQQPRDGAAKPL